MVASQREQNSSGFGKSFRWHGHSAVSGEDTLNVSFLVGGVLGVPLQSQDSRALIALDANTDILALRLEIGTHPPVVFDDLLFHFRLELRCKLAVAM